MIQFNVNTDAAVKLTVKLEKLHKSAFPSAVRGTLNKLVFDVKTKTMPDQASKNFENRQPNFFKANSKFENAAGFDVSTMKATIGFISTGLKGGNNFSVADLEQQEFGGTIKKKSFIPMKPARVGNSSTKVVRANARLNSLKRIVNSKNASGKNDKEKFRKSVYHAGVGGLVLGNKNPAILWKVNSLKRLPGGVFKMTPLYTYKKGRSVKVSATHFEEKAAEQSTSKSDSFYFAEATRQFNKFL